VIIVQIAPEIGPGTGVGAVAHALEREWRALGHDVRRFTLDDAGASRLPAPGLGARGKLALAARVVWFSTIGTARARRLLRTLPQARSVCHNDVLAGDLYVNHGNLHAAMRSRGHYLGRMLRNPMHLFVWGRDRHRYRSSVHRLVVNLSERERTSLLATYRVTPPTTTIGNGVDLERFHPATADERRAARAASGIADGARVVVFVGHEYGRKGLDVLLEAMARVRTPHVLLVAGGDPGMVAGARALAAQLGVADRVVFQGTVADARPALAAADVLCLPSSYEAHALVVLEALACGLPVVATPVGAAPELVDGANGVLVERDAAAVAAGLDAVAALDPAAAAAHARATAERFSWHEVALRYLDALARARPETAAAAAR